jgi:hypothetical protein
MSRAREGALEEKYTWKVERMHEYRWPNGRPGPARHGTGTARHDTVRARPI